MKKKLFHLWHSKEQKDWQRKIALANITAPVLTYAETEQGDLVEYTEMVPLENKNPLGKFDDHVYLGRGWYDSTRDY